jgi:hypothetical protein
MRAPWYSITPGIAVSVVNSYAAVSDWVCVVFERSVLLPTEGKPISATRASPALLTSNPTPAGPDLDVGSSSCAR